MLKLSLSKSIRDPLWKDIRMPEELYNITKTIPFLRLYNIKQLGPAELFYPGASHTRAAHSVGVYYTAFRMLTVLLETGGGAWITCTGAISFLAAALLHDLGHFPFTHSLKELDLKEHEQLTGELVIREPIASLIGNAGGDCKQTQAIIDKTVPAAAETEFFRKILSGVLDPDKLDYLNRDAYYCGVPYGIQDTDFILSQIYADNIRGVTINSKAILSIESILFSKYLMYKAVYWLKGVRIATAMMKKAVFAGVKQGQFSKEALYNQDDDGIFRLIENCKYEEKEIAGNLKSAKLYIPVLELPFSYADCFSILEDLDKRHSVEVYAAEVLSCKFNCRIYPKDILIDVPERISFESDLFVKDENKTFTESSTIFSRSLIKNFTESLRLVRLAVHQDFYGKLSSRLSLMPELFIKAVEAVHQNYKFM